MTMYTDMVKENAAQKIRYETEFERIKKTEVNYPWVDFNDHIYSDSMLHSVIVIINRLNNQK